MWFRPRKSSLSYPTENDDDDVGEEADEVVPEGVEEVELARVNLEHKEQQHRLLLSDIRKLSVIEDLCTEHNMKNETDLWMVNGGRTELVRFKAYSYASPLFILYLICNLEFKTS